MIKLPPDSPDWLESVLVELEDRAREQVCKGASAERGAGYFSAVEDLKAEIDVQAAKIEEKRQKMVREMRLGASVA